MVAAAETLMNKRNRLNLGLLGLVTALLLIAVFEPGRESPPTPVPLLELAPEQVQNIGIERPGQEAVVLRKQAGAWFLIKPLEAPGNTALIDAVLKITTAVCPLRYPSTALELAKLQLDPPLLTLILNDQELAFGGTESLDNRRYLRIKDTVYLCTDRYYYLLTGTAASFAAGQPPKSD